MFCGPYTLGACQVLVVDDDYHMQGMCKDCAYLALEEEIVPFVERSSSGGRCDRRSNGRSSFTRGEIKHIATDNPRLEEISHIGAFLRYKI